MSARPILSGALVLLYSGRFGAENSYDLQQPDDDNPMRPQMTA
jgi:hypothetical protein